MYDEPKVFSSNITRGVKPLNNNLRNLISIIPAEPIKVISPDINENVDFIPRNDKMYRPKKKAHKKVKTVRDIRCDFENDIYNFLPDDLDNQKHCLLKKITGGFFKDASTLALAQKLLKSDHSLSRSTWQMLMNINPNNYTYATQFVSYHGKRIQLVGSKGGSCKFVWNFDLGNKKIPNKPKLIKIKKNSKIKGLLKNSLDLKIKPGPLTKKKDLDTSFQKYHVGKIEIVDLPTPVLEICPKYGVTLEPTITNFLHSLRDQSELISEKWAQFAVSMIGDVKNNNPVQNSERTYLNFDLNYSYNQRRMLMRSGSEKMSETFTSPLDSVPNSENVECLVMPEVINIVDKILDTVEISLKQDIMITTDESIPKIDENKLQTNNNHKEKHKRKYVELERLDVTVITLEDDKSEESRYTCDKDYCKLGCVCPSLSGVVNLKNHCGRIDCMFTCKCDFSQYKAVDCSDGDCADFIPCFLNLDEKTNLKLAKEEQKFHQTVIVTREKSIVLKSQKRNWKATKKYGDFYDTMCLKNKKIYKKTLYVDLSRLNCANVEPWCMVHNLYHCFCKGRFTHEFGGNSNTTNDDPINYDYNSRSRSESNKIATGSDFSTLDMIQITSRVRPYLGRKYNNEYYAQTNKKILLLEKDDTALQKRLLSLIDHKPIKRKSNGKKNENSEKVVNLIECDVIDLDSSTEQLNEFVEDSPREQDTNLMELTITDSDKPIDTNDKPLDTNDIRRLLLKVTDTSQNFPNKNKFVKWLETSYKGYKQRLDKVRGNILCLIPPKPGKVVLYPWDFILDRYKERKNLFIVSKKPPFRIYMAVDVNNSFFKDCMNIDEIRFADLPKYPVTVKNLLANAKDLSNHFCILCGLSYCWELMGSVAKLNEINEGEKEIDALGLTAAQNENLLCENKQADSHFAGSTNQEPKEEDESTDYAYSSLKNKTDCSKWFFMTLEKDFDEIQFQEKGFFVKHQNIIKAINVARASGQTVRLSSQKCLEIKKGPPFGIYATPNTSEYNVFVGPYEEDESLGLNTVWSTISGTNTNRTRGVWIKTNKVDDFKVIDNPISFIPRENNLSYSDLVFLDTGKTKSPLEKPDMNINNVESLNSNRKDNDTTGCSPIKGVITKMVKPIKIRKSNGFYHLAPLALKQSAAKSITQTSPPKIINLKQLLHSEPSYSTSTLDIVNQNTKQLILKHDNQMTKLRPVAEIAPHVKSKEMNKVMFILKPDEINQKLLNSSKVYNNKYESNTSDDKEMDSDIEIFLATSKECSSPNITTTLLISDDEDEPNIPSTKINNDKEVFIVCENLTNIGWIPAKRNLNNHLSFKFPGLKYTKFYPEAEAFNLINRVLARKIYIPTHISFVWKVVDSESKLNSRRELETSDFVPGTIMTNNGLQQPKSKSIICRNLKVEPDRSELSVEETNSTETPAADTSISSLSEGIDVSQLLEDEGNKLWNDAVNKKTSILASLANIPDDLRNNLTESLKHLISNDDSDS